MRTARYPDDDTPLTTRYRSVIPAGCPLMIAGAVWTAAQAREIRGQGADLVAMARAAIGHPDWPSRARQDPDYSPQRPPFTPEHLARAALSPPFIEYMRRWAGFVTDGRPPRD
jgi:2,4-dienoyl-CoA reductase-like NADH-dependent reductase (Old Yellow Enzyme family)